MAAIMVIILKNIDTPGYSFSNLFSFYTIQSNIIVIITLLVSVFSQKSKKLDDYRGQATLYIVITGVIYHLLLRGVDVQLNTAWINLALHTVAPLYVLIDWLWDPPAKNMPAKHAVSWLGFPAAYAVYTLVRGELTGWYPYPFIDINEIGYARFLLNAFLMLVAFYAMAILVSWLPNLSRRFKL